MSAPRPIALLIPVLTCLARWIAGKISDILGNEDDVVIELCFNLIEGPRYVWLTSPDLPRTHADGFADSQTSSHSRSNSRASSIKILRLSVKTYGDYC